MENNNVFLFLKLVGTTGILIISQLCRVYMYSINVSLYLFNINFFYKNMNSKYKHCVDKCDLMSIQSTLGGEGRKTAVCCLWASPKCQNEFFSRTSTLICIIVLLVVFHSVIMCWRQNYFVIL